MVGSRSKSLSLAVFVFISLVLVACDGTRIQVSTIDGLSSSAVITDIASVDELQSMFNQDAGSTRLVLLLSPT